MKLIGLAGRIGCGKTTAAKMLVEGFGFSRNRFAGPLKDMLRALGLTDEELDGSLKETPCDLLGGKTPRWAQQALGTEWGRELIDPDLWTRAWKMRCKTPKVVADDVRFPNEAKLIREMGGIVVMIERPKQYADVGLHGEQMKTDPTNPSSVHASERFEFEPDITIVNDGTLDELYEKIRGIYDDLLKKEFARE